MGFLLSHMLPVLIAGLIIAVVAAVWGFAAVRWEADKTPEEREQESVCQGCPGCQFMKSCGKTKDGKPIVTGR